MKCPLGFNWKHATQIYPLPEAEVTHVAVFDDEQKGHVTLYKTDGKRFSPCRSVATTDAEHFSTVLGAWASDHPLLDLRQDKSLALPAPDCGEPAK